MPTKKPPPPRPTVTIDFRTGHRNVAVYEWRTYRILLDNGEVMDVEAIRDDSELRTAVLQLVGRDRRIAGVADITPVRSAAMSPEPDPVEPEPEGAPDNPDDE
jgi:hypothetical protein